jgi:hypothetical protein
MGGEVDLLVVGPPGVTQGGNLLQDVVHVLAGKARVGAGAKERAGCFAAYLEMTVESSNSPVASVVPVETEGNQGAARY